MKRILTLVPEEDHSEHAVTLATEICRRTGAGLVLLRVLEERVDWPVVQPHSISGPSLKKLLVEHETAALAQVAKRLAPDLEDLEVEVVWGVPWEVVVARVEAEEFDLVIKPAWGLTPERRVFFGLTAIQLFRHCACPVWVVGDLGRLPERILAAIDPTPGDTRRQVAARILEWSMRVAALDPDARVDVGTAWDAPGAQLMRRTLRGPEVDEYVADSRQRATQELGAVLDAAGFPEQPERVHLLEGSAREALPIFIEDEAFDLVVLGTVGRNGLAGELLGETAEWILRAVRCSVLCVSPRHSGAEHAARPTPTDSSGQPASHK